MYRQEYANLTIFEGLGSDQIHKLSPFMEEVHFEMDQVIFEQGQLANCLYILLAGKVIVRYKPYDGPPLTVTMILPGGVFGWSAALGRKEYTSGAAAVECSTAYRVRTESLKQLCSNYPDTGNVLLDRLAGVIAERLKSTHSEVYQILVNGIGSNANSKKER
jgi:CRP/FNR family transcriptional regulator, cyclic AMP receptor protein